MPGNLEAGLHYTRTRVRDQEKTLISQGFLGSQALRFPWSTVLRMADEFSQRSFAGARFRDVDYAGPTFEQVSLTGAVFNDVNLSGVKIRGALVRDVDIGGELAGLRVNGVDVAPLIEAELDRLHPERLRPKDAVGFLRSI